MTGMGVPSTVCINDVIALDVELLAMVPRPVYALLLLYPLTDNVSYTSCSCVKF